MLYTKTVVVNTSVLERTETGEVTLIPEKFPIGSKFQMKAIQDVVNDVSAGILKLNFLAESDLYLPDGSSVKGIWYCENLIDSKVYTTAKEELTLTTDPDDDFWLVFEISYVKDDSAPKNLIKEITGLENPSQELVAAMRDVIEIAKKSPPGSVPAILNILKTPEAFNFKTALQTALAENNAEEILKTINAKFNSL